jgi:hypothetical protein
VRPDVRWFAELRPLPPKEGAEVGPGTRSKNERAEWVVTGKHPLDEYLRDGAKAAEKLGLQLRTTPATK